VEQPDRQTVRRVLVAAADVAFGDGVSPQFLEQWIDETCYLLSIGTGDGAPPSTLREVAGGTQAR